jgi:hypothetical protein
VILFLQCQSLVIDKPTRARESAHSAQLIAVWDQFVSVSLQTFHTLNYIWAIKVDHQLACVKVVSVIYKFSESLQQKLVLCNNI